jgi:hypothetical protein
MTKAQAIDRVCKLRALAKSTTSVHERETATRQASALAAKHQIAEAELLGSGKGAAFDDLAQAFSRYTNAHPDLYPTVVEIVEMVVGRGKRLSRGRKSVLVDQVTAGLKIAKFVFGDSNKTLNDVAAIVSSVLDTYDVLP